MLWGTLALIERLARSAAAARETHRYGCGRVNARRKKAAPCPTAERLRASNMHVTSIIASVSQHFCRWPGVKGS
jgi:hypothetical protein